MPALTTDETKNPDLLEIFLAVLKTLKNASLPIVFNGNEHWHRLFRTLQLEFAETPQACPDAVCSLEFELTSLGIRSPDIDRVIAMLAFLGFRTPRQDASRPEIDLDSEYVEDLHGRLRHRYPEFFEEVPSVYADLISVPAD